MTPLEAFLDVNHIKQVDLVNYLGLKKGTISSAVSGKSQLSRRKMLELFSNPYGWDTSMLDKPTIIQTNGNNSPNSQNITLGDYNLKHLQEQNKLMERIIELQDENARLREENRKLAEEINTLRK